MGHGRRICDQYPWVFVILERAKDFRPLLGANMAGHYSTAISVLELFVQKLEDTGEWSEYNDLVGTLLHHLAQDREPWEDIQAMYLMLSVIDRAASKLDELEALYRLVYSVDYLALLELKYQRLLELLIGCCLLLAELDIAQHD